MSGIKRCRIGKEQTRLRTSAIRDLVLEVACCHHTLRLRPSTTLAQSEWGGRLS
ncbi:MAG: hypothetical protein AAGF95_34650 [Chloroflexota bacterium]